MTLSRNSIKPFIFFLALSASSATFAEDNKSDQAPNHIFTSTNIHWVKGPESLPKGAEIAVLEGDPKQAGAFTMRLKFPANYRIPPHYHPSTEHVTVLSGNLYLGMGDKFDEKNANLLPAGGFAFMLPKMHHYAFTREQAVIQLHGIGPWGITYLDPNDDSRNKKQ